MCNPTLNLVPGSSEIYGSLDRISTLSITDHLHLQSHAEECGEEGGDGLTGWSDGRWWIFEGRVGGNQGNGCGGLVHEKVMAIAEDRIHLALGTCSLVLYVLRGGLLCD